MLDDVILMVIAFLGIVMGVVIGKHTYEELKAGEKYFVLFKNLVLLAMALMLLFGIKRISIELLVLFLMGFLVAYFLRFTYLFLGFAAAASIMAGKQLAILPLIYVYGMPFGTIRYYHIKNNLKLLRIILVNFILFMLPLGLMYFEFNEYVLMAFSAGALLANIR